MSKRIPQLDFLKGILILHVIMIHLVYLGECHPDFKRFMLLFATPSFFTISGFLAHVNKPSKLFGKKVFWWLVPYVIMEGAYIVMASLLPIKEHISHLDIFVFLDHLLLSPLGPYWYIHDLIVCYVSYFLLYKAVAKRNKWTWVLAGVPTFLLLTVVLKIAIFQSCVFFGLGILIKQAPKGFVSFFHPSWLSLPLIIVFYFWHESLGISDSTRNIIFSYLVINFWLYTYKYIPSMLTNIVNKIGRNTLAILLFSPMFTILTKAFVPYLSFEPTAILFTIVSTTFTTVGCLAVTYAMDKCRLSKYFFGEEHYLKV